MAGDFDDDDPFGDEGLSPVAPKKKRASVAAVADAESGPADPGAVGDEDRTLANELCNDFGNAVRFRTRHGQDVMYVEGIGFFVWDGARWSKEGGGAEARKRADLTAQAIWREIDAVKKWPGKGDPDEKIKRLARHAVMSGNTGSINAMLTAVAPYLSKPVDALDADPFLVACPNGTIELGRHCEFRESRRSDYLTRRIGIAYNTKAQCPTWLKFLERIMPDQEMRDFLQRVLGYCLSGSTREQVMFLFYGTGRNGKSTLVNVVRHILGDYAMSVPVSTFLAKREGSSGGEASPDLARLPGARLVTISEPPENGRLDESRVKDVTGGDTMTVRHLNQGFFDFKPVFKAVVSTNHLPIIRGADHGIWARVRLILFGVRIPDSEMDRDLEAKLLAEAEGVLQWMLTGCEEWFVQGLAPPDSARAAVENYRADMDPVGEFIKDCCALTDKTDPATDRVWETSAKGLHNAYKKWSDDNALEPLGTRTFGTKLTARGLQRRKTNGVKMYVGIMLKASAVVDPGAELVDRRVGGDPEER